MTSELYKMAQANPELPQQIAQLLKDHTGETK